MALIGYARVSTVGQDLQIQRTKLKEAGCDKIFAGQHSGKADTNRLQLEKLLDYVREGDTVVVTKLDRLGRSLSQVLSTLDHLKKRDVGFKALDQQIDTSDDSPLSKAMVQLLGMFAELERNFIVTRTQEGKLASGRFGGRPSVLESKEKMEVLRLHSMGTSKRALAQRFGVSRQTIQRIIARLETRREVDPDEA